MIVENQSASNQSPVPSNPNKVENDRQLTVIFFEYPVAQREEVQTHFLSYDCGAHGLRNGEEAAEA